MQFAPNKLKKIEGKIHLKETSQPCLYFGNFCGGGGRIGNLYINNNKNKWIGFSSKGVGIEGLIRRGRTQTNRVKGGPKWWIGFRVRI